MIVRRLASLVSLIVLVAASLPGCSDPPKCAPGTLFVTLSFDARAREADSLELYAQVGEKTYSAKVPYGGTGTTIQLEFAQGAYPGGKRISLVILALRNGEELSRAAEPELYVPYGCAAVNLTFTGPGDLSVRPDFAIPVDMCRRDTNCSTPVGLD